MFGKEGGSTGGDNDFIVRGFENLGAWIIGRNMFSPGRGAWDMSWKGWWGANPPYHTPVFVLTHHPRESLVMEGGTTFHFVTDGIHSALKQARDAAKGKDVRIGGGASTIQQYLREKVIDEMHVAVSPVFLGSGERLFNNVDMRALGYQCVQHTASPNAVHFVFKRNAVNA